MMFSRRLSVLSRRLTQKAIPRCFLSTGPKNTFILHAAGVDRLGIVSDVTGLVIEQGGNVGESFSGRLGQSYFSLMMLVENIQDPKKLQASIRDLPGLDSAVFQVDPLDSGSVKVSPQIAYSGAFSLEGADNPGIVHKVTSLLAESGLNIDKLETDQDIAPHGGTVLFKMHGTAVHTAPLPRSFDIAKIKKDMEELGDSLNCEIKLGDATDDRLRLFAD